jgi:hypothetical protein
MASDCQYSKKFAPSRMIARITEMKYVVGRIEPSAEKSHRIDRDGRSLAVHGVRLFLPEFWLHLWGNAKGVSKKRADRRTFEPAHRSECSQSFDLV